MATDTEIQPLLDDLMATPRQLQQCGVPVRIGKDTQGKPVTWVGLAGVTMQGGSFAFDSAKVMEA